MASDSIAVRLNRIMIKGKFSVADLAHWLNRPHSTVRLWVRGETEPQAGASASHLTLQRLEALERYVRAGHLIPETSAYERPLLIKQARDDFQRGIVPARNTA